MIEYFVLLGLPLLVYFEIETRARILHETRMNGNKAALFLFFLIYFLLLAFRAECIGNDTAVYFNHLDLVSNLQISDLRLLYPTETGYWLYVKFADTVFDNSQLFLGLTAFLYVWPIYALYKDKSENAVLSITCFLILPIFGMLFSGLRQSLAIGITAFSFRYIEARKPFKYVVAVLFASLFHLSALIALLIYPIYYMELTRKKMIVFPIVVFLFYRYSKEIVSFFVTVFGRYQERYAERIFDNGAYGMLVLFLIMVVFSYFAVDPELIDRETKGLRNILVFTALIQCLASALQVLMRVNYYYILYIPLLLPKIVNRARVNKRIAKFAEIVMCIFFAFYFLSGVWKERTSFSIYPYVPFWKYP